MTKIEPLLDKPEAARIAKTSTRTVHRWILNGELAAIKIGRLVRIRPSTLKEFLDAREGFGIRG